MLAVEPCIAQKEYNVWCLGAHVGIDFNGAVPTPIYSAFNTWEACANICDPNSGALLFYSDGEKVYNGDHQMMPNGGGLLGNANSTQGALIVPMPGNARQYYLFTSDAGDYDRPPNQGVHYSIVDMNMDGGRGDIITKNIPLLDSATEKLTAIRHANGCSFWVLCHGWDDSTFYAYLVSDQGVAAPVLSRVGSVHRDASVGTGLGTIGYMKASPDGKRVAVAMYDAKLLEIFDFDDRSGTLSNPLSIAMDFNPYGVAFSPDNTKLYVSCGPNALYQFDFTDPRPASIIASETLISAQVDTERSERYSALQLAPDGMIYHAHSFTQWLGAIHDPNAKGSACNYAFHEIDLGAIVLLGLPNLIDGFYNSGNLACGAPIVNFTPGDTVICAGSCIDFTDLTTNNPTAWQWTFTGAATAASSDRNPNDICFSDPGTYRVTLKASNALGTSSWSRNITVSARGDLKAHIGGEFIAAPGDTLTLPLTLDEAIDNARIAELSITLDYGIGMLDLESIDLSHGVLAGWSIDSVHDDRAGGRSTIYLSAPGGQYLQGIGRLADLRFIVYLGQTDTARINFALSSPTNRCLGALAEPGRVVLNLCGARGRLIRFGASSYALDQNHPNPFNPSTVIPFSLGLDGHVRLSIRNALGQYIATLIDGDMAAGAYEITWDASAYPSGTYYCELATGPWSAVRRMVMVK
jgi:PKD repeat protein